MKQIVYKLVILFTAISLIISNNHILIFASTNDIIIVGNNTTLESYETEVIYNQSSEYAVTIPKTISIDGDKETTFAVKVNGDISSDSYVYVSPIDNIRSIDGINFYMIDQSLINTKEKVLANIQYVNYPLSKANGLHKM